MSHFARQISQWIYNSILNPIISLSSQRVNRNPFAKISYLIIFSCLFANEKNILIEDTFSNGKPKIMVTYEVNSSSGEWVLKEKSYYYKNGQIKATVEYPNKSSGKFSHRKIQKEPKWKFYSIDGKKVDSVNFEPKYSYAQLDSIINVLHMESVNIKNSIEGLQKEISDYEEITSRDIDSLIIDIEKLVLEEKNNSKQILNNQKNAELSKKIPKIIESIPLDSIVPPQIDTVISSPIIDMDGDGYDDASFNAGYEVHASTFLDSSMINNDKSIDPNGYMDINGDGYDDKSYDAGFNAGVQYIKQEIDSIIIPIEVESPVFIDENKIKSTNEFIKEISQEEKIQGCTDPIASNYASTANINDGSCIYVEDYKILFEKTISYWSWHSWSIDPFNDPYLIDRKRLKPLSIKTTYQGWYSRFLQPTKRITKLKKDFEAGLIDQTIVLYTRYDGKDIVPPFISSIDWYLKKRIEHNNHTEFQKYMVKNLLKEKTDSMGKNIVFDYGLVRLKISGGNYATWMEDELSEGTSYLNYRGKIVLCHIVH